MFKRVINLFFACAVCLAGAIFEFGFGASVAMAANNCTGATYYDSVNDTCIACPTGYDYNTDSGKTSVTQCQTHCDAGTYVPEYTQVEYIESTGTQYIDTGVMIESPTSITGSTIDFQVVSVDGLASNTAMIAGAIRADTNAWKNVQAIVYQNAFLPRVVFHIVKPVIYMPEPRPLQQEPARPVQTCH